MKRSHLLFLSLLVSGCATTTQTQREPASSVNMSCSEMLNSFFKATPANPEFIAKIGKDIKVIKKWSEEHTYDYSFAEEIEVDEGAILKTMFFKNSDPKSTKDSLGRTWKMIEDKDGIRFRRYLDESQSEFIDIEAQPLTAVSTKMLVELPSGQQLTIVVPENGLSSLADAFLNEITPILGDIPIDYVKKLKYISFSPGPYYNGGAPATANFKEIAFYAKKPGGVFLRNYKLDHDLLRHEFGHMLAAQVFNSMTPPAAWKEAIKLDKASVSKYGDTMIEEDFAETVELYLRLEAENNLGDKRWLKYKNRFAELDQIFHNDPQKHYRVARTIALKKQIPIYTVMFGTATGGAYYVWDASGGE